MARKPGHELNVSTEIKALWREALKARKKAYAPYSKFLVGAALPHDGRIVSGCNIENASYGGTICAERVAILKAMSEKRALLTKIVIVAAKPVPPCGLCLQTLSEFGTPEMEIWLGSPKGLHAKHTLKNLLPLSFGPQDLKRE